MSFPKYPRYKDSGVEWLGEVPEHWTATQLKRVVDPQRPITYGIVQAGPHVPDGIAYVRPTDMRDEAGVLNPDDLLRTSYQIAQDYRRSTILVGDLVCSIGPSFGKVMVTPASLNGANLTQGTARVAVSSQSDARYIFWVLRSDVSIAQWESSIGGATFRALNLGPLAATGVPVPPLAEQRLIASMLDRETAKIDALIAEQQRLIELLKEKRQAVISHAVTRGLNPDAPTKPSGVEWLGDVPAHWTVAPIKSLATMHGRIGYRGYSTTDIVDAGEGAITLSPSNLTSEIVSLQNSTYVSWDKYHESPEIQVGYGDILMVKTGSSFGKVASFPNEFQPATINPQLLILRALGCDRHFLLHALNSPHVQASIKVGNSGSSIPTVSQELIGGIRIPIPPPGEQAMILAHIRLDSERLAALIHDGLAAIALLRERRTALISAAVTGKIDVRGLADRAA